MIPMKIRSPTVAAMSIVPLLCVVLLTSGCGPTPNENDEFLKEFSRKQATHHDSLLRQSEQLSKASQQLIEADATARGELVEMQSRLQQEFEAERRSIDGQRDKLDNERRDIAEQRHRDPLIATAILQGVALLIAALPLVLLWLMVRAARDEPADIPLAELLVHEFSADEPLLLPAPRQSETALPLQEEQPAAIVADTRDDLPDDTASDDPTI